MTKPSYTVHQLENILEAVSQCIFISDGSRIKYINKQGSAFFECPKTELYSKKISEFTNKDTFDRFFLESQDTSTSLLFTNCKGQTRQLQLSAIPIIWENQELKLIYATDLDKQRNVEIAQQKAKETDLLKNIFLANMSHEIRTPLNAIIGFSQLLSYEELSEDLQKRYYQLIENNGNQLLELIDDIIDLSKIESGQMVVKKNWFKVNDLIDAIYKSFKEKIELEYRSKKIEILVSYPKKSENIYLNSDKQRIAQVLNNLIKNALKYTNKGKITIAYKVLNRSTLEFYIKDTGIGIQKDMQEIIFNKFHQLNKLGTLNSKKTGLGLSISKNIVELLGGTISVESTFGKGATFSFSLPYKNKSHQITTTKMLKTSATFFDWSDKTILLAEDEESNYLFIREVLRRTKANLIWVKNGQDAVSALENDKKIDLVLMDIQMPVMDGYDAFSLIREKSYAVPIIAQTAYAMVDEKEKILDMGFDSYISKPIQIRSLLQIISELIEK